MLQQSDMAFAEKHFERAIELLDAGKLAESEALLRKLLAMGGAPVSVPLLLAEVLAQRGNMAGAVNFARRACDLEPTALGVLLRAALVFRRADDRTATLELLNRAVGLARVEPEPSADGAAAWQMLCEALSWCGRDQESLEMAMEARRLRPDSQEIANQVAAAQMNLDHVGPAMDVLRDSTVRWPHQPSAHILLAMGGTYDPRVGLGQGFEDHLRMGMVLERAIAQDAAAQVGQRWPTPGPADAERPLRVGILSHDLRTHSVAFFLEPLLEAVRAMGGEMGTATGTAMGLRMIALHTCPIEDVTSARLRPLFDEWHNIGHMVDARSAEFIAAQRIDVLIECNGLTAGERLVLLQLAPAPLQVTYLGYPNITGLPTVQARLTDAITDPPEADAALRDAAARVGAVRHERLYRMDGPFLCYKPLADMPAVVTPPCTLRDADGEARTVMFGSFNAIRKLSDEVLALWGRVVAGVAGSRLLIKNQALASPDARENLLVRLERAGVARDRVVCAEYTGSMQEHLACYGWVDVALDSYPYCGTTTTCEALVMGVPVISRVGQTHASRVGLALLERVGLGELACASDDAFVEAAVNLARDTERLTALRAALRGRLLGSSLCDAAGMGDRFARAVRELWRERCGRTG